MAGNVKLITEPWDLGEGGYQVGNFGGATKGRQETLPYRLIGNSDLCAHDGRRPYASINFVTAHDGFTLDDLVSYNPRHNAVLSGNSQL